MNTIEINMGRKDLLVIGIDPDSEKSGIGAFYEGRLVECSALRFPELIDRIVELSGSYPRTEVYVEAGWLNRGNWHVTARNSVQKAAAMGGNMGACNQTGKLIVEMCRAKARASVSEVKPFRKCWHGPDRKITPAELEQVIGQELPKKNNQEMRDATLIAWCCK